MAKLQLPTRFDNLNKHYSECLELHCSLCQRFLELLVSEMPKTLVDYKCQPVINYQSAPVIREGKRRLD